MAEDRTQSKSAPLREDQTEVPPPNRRVFLPQSFGERLLCAVWFFAWAMLFRPTPVSWGGWRRFLLRRFGASVGSGSLLHPSIRIDFPWNLAIGDNVLIEHQVILNCMGEIVLQDGCRISQYAHLCAGTHVYEDRRMPIVRAPIAIGRGVWIAADAFVGPGVSIGDGSLLAARSSAFGNLPEGQVCIGEPARPYKRRFAREVEHTGPPQRPV